MVRQRHTARAFWHLASMEGPAAEAAVSGESLGALLQLAAPEGKQGAQMARQALRRLCEDPSVRCMPRTPDCRAAGHVAFCSDLIAHP